MSSATFLSPNISRKRVTIVSILFMGLAHILLLKQYVKGAFFAFVQLLFIGFLPYITGKISDLITLGVPQPDLPIRMRDNSLFMMIDGIIVVAIIGLFVAAYIISIRSARLIYDEAQSARRLPDAMASMRDIGGRSFPILALAPTIVMLLFFVVVPLVFSAAVAFTNYSGPDNIPPANTIDWVGADNFVSMFGGDTVWAGAVGRVALWTVMWAALATFTCYFGGLIIAVILSDSGFKAVKKFRPLFILPYAIPAVISMMVWRNLLNGSFGTINRTLLELGWITEIIPWLTDAWLARFSVVMLNLWAGFPYFMMLSTGAMTSIPSDIYEAAGIDGANKIQQFRYITLPTVLYQTTPLIILSFTHNINNFGAIFFLTGGNPVMPDSTTTSAGGTDILVTWIYNLTVNLFQYNRASVIAVMIFVALAPFAIWSFRRTKSFKEGDF